MVTVTTELRNQTKDARQALRYAREAKALQKKARRKGSLNREQERDLLRAQRYLREHPVDVKAPDYELG